MFDQKDLPRHSEGYADLKDAMVALGVGIFLVVLFSGFLLFGPELGILVAPLASPSASPTSFGIGNPTALPSPTFSMSPPSTVFPTPSFVPLVSPGPLDGKQAELVDYALSLINSDRQKYGLQNVTLSRVNSGQIHADNMLQNHYLSHWDMNGYKPYMRYTLAGGLGAVAENVAWQGQTGNVFPINVKSAIKDLEFNMMYQDASSNWDHRDNILNPRHNKVSIGVGYDDHNVYLVQDFEDDYVIWSQRNVDNDQITLKGTIQTEGTIRSVAIFYDSPSNLTVTEIKQPQYQDGYGPGTYVGMALPPNWQATDGSVTITTSSWSQNGDSFEIGFSLSQATAAYGAGVYTLYLATGSSTAESLTTYSIWIG